MMMMIIIIINGIFNSSVSLTYTVITRFTIL